MLTCIVFIGASMGEVTVIWYYLFYRRRGTDAESNKKLTRLIDIVAATIYAVAFFVFLIVYFVNYMQQKKAGFVGMESELKNFTCPFISESKDDFDVE